MLIEYFAYTDRKDIKKEIKLVITRKYPLRGYSSLSNKRAAQIIVFLKKCSLHSLITSCTNYCFLEKMQPALLLTSCTNQSYSKICQTALECICIFLLIPNRCIKLQSDWKGMEKISAGPARGTYFYLFCYITLSQMRARHS